MVSLSSLDCMPKQNSFWSKRLLTNGRKLKSRCCYWSALRDLASVRHFIMESREKKTNTNAQSILNNLDLSLKNCIT